MNLEKKTKINNCILHFIQKLNPNSHILDVGCGTGYPIDYYLANIGFKVTGIDISNKMIKKARSLKLKNSIFMVKDILKYSSSEKYDAIIAFDSLWHIEYSSQTQIYKILSNLLKKNGYLIFTHGKKDSIVISEMFGEKFYYSAS